MAKTALKTPEQVKAEYRAKGIPLSRVAKEQGWFPKTSIRCYTQQTTKSPHTPMFRNNSSKSSVIQPCLKDLA